MENTAKKRWVSLYVENDVGVLAKISGLFSGKSYNLCSLTVGETEDPTVSRMTISLYGDDKTFEQIIKQLNRSVEVIKVLDFTDLSIHKKEILYIKLHSLRRDEMEDVINRFVANGSTRLGLQGGIAWLLLLMVYFHISYLGEGEYATGGHEH